MSSMTAEEYSGFLKLASVLVRFDHIASIIVNAKHSASCTSFRHWIMFSH